MPFDEQLEDIYDLLIKPSLEKSGFTVTRADNILDQQNILAKIIRGIAAADLIVADLSNLNANVLYELGICHGLNVPCVLLTQKPEEVPFDLHSYQLVKYSTQFRKAEDLAEYLRVLGRAHVSGEIDFGSPVSDFLKHIGQPRRWDPDPWKRIESLTHENKILTQLLTRQRDYRSKEETRQRDYRSKEEWQLSEPERTRLGAL